MKLHVFSAILRTFRSKDATFKEKLVFSWIFLKSKMQVLSGPFHGMNYVPQSAGSAYFPKLLGIYEKELEKIIEGVIKRGPEAIVDAGAAEGYFAVGLATRCPEARIVACDMDFRACYFLQMLAEMNHVRDRVEVHCKPCTCEDLANALAGSSRPFLLMDVEGAEESLLDPDVVPSLLGTEILVELHATERVPDMAGFIAGKFSSTHRLREVMAEPRTPGDSPIALGAFTKAAATAVNEGREPGQKWLHMLPLTWQTSLSPRT